MDIDVNKPLENPALCALFQKWKTISPANTKAGNSCLNEIIEEVVMNAHFLAVVQFDEKNFTPSSDGTQICNKGTAISFPHFVTEDKQALFPAFTDWRELRKGDAYKNAEVQTLILSFDDYYPLLEKNNAGLIINPFSDSLSFSWEEIKHFQKIKAARKADGQEMVVKKGTEVLLGEPKDIPTQMIQAICKYAQNEKNIRAIWLKLMIKRDEQSFLLIVDCTDKINHIFEAIANAARPYLAKGMFIDMVPMQDDFGKRAATGEPFYTRKE